MYWIEMGSSKYYKLSSLLSEVWEDNGVQNKLTEEDKKLMSSFFPQIWITTNAPN